MRNYVAPALAGKRARDRTSACRAVEGALKGRIWTKAAVNVALHDLQAKGLGVRLDWDMIEANRAGNAN